MRAGYFELAFKSHVSRIALTNVPAACAAKGEIKCSGLNKCIEAASDSGVAKFAPDGGGISARPNCKTSEFEMAPSRIEAIQIRIFLTAFTFKLSLIKLSNLYDN